MSGVPEIDGHPGNDNESAGLHVTPSYTSGYLLVVFVLLGNAPVLFWYLGLREKALA
jgi:hypothetical protein